MSWQGGHYRLHSFPCQVTLHVSVWVEISATILRIEKNYVTLHVSVWVEISKLTPFLLQRFVTLHVSVWVEICPFSWNVSNDTRHAPRERVSWNFLFVSFSALSRPSRSTWACELKFMGIDEDLRIVGHAPRERVSWNCTSHNRRECSSRHAPRERVSWNAFLIS